MANPRYRIRCSPRQPRWAAAAIPYQNVIGFFAQAVLRETRLTHVYGAYDAVFGKMKQFVQTGLFDRPVALEDRNVLRNLAEIEASRTLILTMRDAVDALIVRDSGTTAVRDAIRFRHTRPYPVKEQPFLIPRRSVFNKVVSDRSGFELAFAAFLDRCTDIVSFVKNPRENPFRIEYRTAQGGIAHYLPDFIVKRTPAELWIIETKGREDLDDLPKRERLQQWCEDATAHDKDCSYRSLYVREDDWMAYRPESFSFTRLVRGFGTFP